MNKDSENNKKQVKAKYPEKMAFSETAWFQSVTSDFPVSYQTPALNFIVFPFHHLISAAQLATNDLPFPSVREERHRFFWQFLIAQGMSASEAALLDDSLNQHFIERTIGAPVEVDWEVLYHHELQGCAELYRTELFTWKRLIYEAGEDLPTVVRLEARQILEFLDNKMPADRRFPETNRLFLDNLTAPFDLAFSTKILNTERDDYHKETGKDRKKQSSSPEYLSHFYSYGSKRAESWIAVGKGDTTALREKTEGEDEKITFEGFESQFHRTADITYHIRLTPYWTVWQQAARASRFDFEYLETVPEAPALRFYELTKLWRALSIDTESSVLPAKVEIEYEKFAALMPLTLMNSERRIKQQIVQVIKPLKASGYVKSFSIKGSLQDIGWRRARLVFRFGD